jgi:hypothetical protein
MSKPKFDGPTIVIGGTEWVVPPLTLKSLRKYYPQLVAMKVGGAPTLEQFDLVRDVVHAALSRNYPEVTPDQVEDMLDMRNMGEVLTRVLSAAGLERRPVGEA